MRRVRTIADYAVYLAVRLAMAAIQALSLESCQAAARRAAWLLWHVLRVRRTVVDANLRIAFPQSTAAQRAAIALGMWEHLLVMVAEIAHAPRKLHRTNWRRHSQIPQMELMVRRLLDPRPVVMISGHLGNFEMGGYMLGLHGFPTHTIARKLDNPFLDRWINRFRAATGQYMLAKDGSSHEIDALLRSGGTLALLGDQHAGKAGCWVDFFGRPASTHKAVALFTLASEAPTAAAAMLRCGAPMQFEMRVADLVDPRDASFTLGTVPLVAQWYTRQLETMIRTAPDQYWWLHQRWREPATIARLTAKRREARAA
ncbi:MAG TPA: lysophospholipid acyltransferase family protein [Lacipirellulaceae bacterium]|nr:lysophospholipid acyltransferase family protein [Lacipirellulaceae bacterium]